MCIFKILLSSKSFDLMPTDRALKVLDKPSLKAFIMEIVLFIACKLSDLVFVYEFAAANHTLSIWVIRIIAVFYICFLFIRIGFILVSYLFILFFAFVRSKRFHEFSISNYFKVFHFSEVSITVGIFFCLCLSSSFFDR